MGKRTDSGRLAEELGMLIARSRRLLFTEASHRLERRGDSMLVWMVLNRLRRDGALTQSDLAFHTGQHPAGTSRLLETLEGEGMVRRTRDPDDRRKVRVALTARARGRLAAIDPDVHEAARDVLSPLSPAEQRALRDLLRKLVGSR